MTYFHLNIVKIDSERGLSGFYFFYKTYERGLLSNDPQKLKGKSYLAKAKL